MSTKIKTADGWKTVANLSESPNRYKRQIVYHPDYANVNAPAGTGPKCNEFTIPKTGIYNYIINAGAPMGKLLTSYILASIPGYNFGYYQMTGAVDRPNDCFVFTGLLKKGEKVSYSFYCILNSGVSDATMRHNCQLTLIEDLSEIFDN